LLAAREREGLGSIGSKTVGGAIRHVSDRLASAGIEGSLLEARLLVAEASNLSVAEVYARPERTLRADIFADILSLAERRERREPLAYVLGRKEFHGRSFEVNEHVLVPRPETETLVEIALQRIGGFERPRILDVGTGSGCIAVTLALELPAASVVATDVSDGALRMARRNAIRLGAVGVRFLRCDLLSAIPRQGLEMVIANPPYIPSSEIDGLMPEIRDHEPRTALDGGEDGLRFHRRLVAQASGALVPGGRLLLETAMGQACSVRAMVAERGYTDVEITKDLAGIGRVVGAIWPGDTTV
jgi:release factor glutamine methyltransferase